MTDRLATALAVLEAEVRDLAPAEVPALLGALERVKATLWAWLASPAPTNGTGEDRLLTVDEAAAKLSTTRDWLRREGRSLPFTVQLSEGQVRYSERAIDRFIATRAGRRGAC